MRTLHAALFGATLATLVLSAAALGYANAQTSACRADELAASAWMAGHPGTDVPAALMPHCTKWAGVQAASLAGLVGGLVGSALLGVALYRGRDASAAA